MFLLNCSSLQYCCLYKIKLELGSQEHVPTVKLCNTSEILQSYSEGVKYFMELLKQCNKYVYSYTEKNYVFTYIHICTCFFYTFSLQSISLLIIIVIMKPSNSNKGRCLFVSCGVQLRND